MMPEVGYDGSAHILLVLCDWSQVECDFIQGFFSSSSLTVKLLNHVDMCRYI